jgi:glycosyltransferase involved in cell wall biosynthesis
MSPTPTVSVVIPAFNAERFVAAALDSVLAQTFKDFEIVVVDDGSTDDTPRALNAYAGAITLERQRNQGVALARNRGVEISRGRWVAFLDADDLWLPEKLAAQMKALAEDPGCGAACSSFVEVDADLRPMRTVHWESCHEPLLTSLLLRGNVVGTPSTVIVKRALFVAVGGLAPGLSQCADWDLWIRLAGQTRFAGVKEPLVWYRRHDASMSLDIHLLERDSLGVLARAFAAEAPSAERRALRRRAYGRNYMVLAGSYYRSGQRRDFLRCALRALWLDPRRVSYLARFPLRAHARRRV